MDITSRQIPKYIRHIYCEVYEELYVDTKPSKVEVLEYIQNNYNIHQFFTLSMNTDVDKFVVNEDLVIPLTYNELMELIKNI